MKDLPQEKGVFFFFVGGCKAGTTGKRNPGL